MNSLYFSVMIDHKRDHSQQLFLMTVAWTQVDLDEHFDDVQTFQIWSYILYHKIHMKVFLLRDV